MAVNEVSRGIVRWAARLAGAGSLAFLLFFVGAHLFVDSQGPAPTQAEWCLLVFFPGGLMIGLGVAFYRQKAGALTALGSMAVFYLVHFAQRGGFPTGPYFLLLTAPAVLFLISSLLDAPQPSQPNTENREPGPSEENPEEPGCGLGTAS